MMVRGEGGGGAAGFRLGFAALLLLGVVLNYAGMAAHPAFPGAGRLVNFLSFFTIQVNLALAATLAVPVLAPWSAAGRFLDRPACRSAMLLYIVVVGLVYAIVLRGRWNPQGLQKVGDVIVHYAAPLLAVIDWVVLVPRGRLAFGDAILWLAFPFAYAVYTLAHGAWSGFYPYPFVDVTTLGFSGVLSHMALFAAGFLLLGLTIIVVDRIGASGRRR